MKRVAFHGFSDGMDFLRHIAKECNITGAKAGSYSCTRVFLTTCFPSELVSAFSGVVKMS